MDKWHTEFAANSEAIERWTARLLRAATELQKLRAKRKRLLRPKGQLKMKRPGGLAEVPRMAAGGDAFNDELPI